MWRDEQGKKLANFLIKWLWLEKNAWHLKPKTGYQKGHSHGIKDLDEFRELISFHVDYTQEEMAKSIK